MDRLEIIYNELVIFRKETNDALEALKNSTDIRNIEQDKRTAKLERKVLGISLIISLVTGNATSIWKKLIGQL